jgi:hypothetical protein
VKKVGGRGCVRPSERFARPRCPDALNSGEECRDQERDYEQSERAFGALRLGVSKLKTSNKFALNHTKKCGTNGVGVCRLKLRIIRSEIVQL